MNNVTKSPDRKIEYIVIHYTAGVSSKKGQAKQVSKYFSKETTKASSDYIVDDEEIIQHNPDIRNQYTWHCGGSNNNGKYYKICTNKNSIGIEICSNNRNNKITYPNDVNYYFTDKAINNTVKLVKNLMKEYNIPIENVIRHYDVTAKLCPGVIGWNVDDTEWKSFKNMLKSDIINRIDKIIDELKCLIGIINESEKENRTN